MKNKNRTRFYRISAISMIACASTQAAVLSDFTNFSESGNLLPSPNLLVQSFSTTTAVGTNSVTATATGGSGSAGQEVFLSDSFSLAAVGSRISASLGSFAGTAFGAQAVGIAVASSESITSRVNLIAFYFRRDAANELGYITFNGSGTFTTLSTNLSGATLAYPDSIFIERTGTGYILGSITGVTSTTHHTLTLGSGNVTADGTAVGIYSDVRANNSVNTLTNFAHVVPEPSTAFLGGLGLLALFRRRR